MAGMTFKYPYEHLDNEYYWINEDALAKDNCDINYFPEIGIINKIKENKEGYFDFNKSLIDIGACYGGYSMLLDFKHNYCFEPSKRFMCLLYTNMYIKDKINNTDVYNCCLSDTESIVRYNGFCCEGSNSPDELRFDIYGEMHDTQAKILDSFDINNVGFIKIDIEGFEEKALRGGVGTIIRNNYPPILFECWDVGYYGMTQEKRDSLFGFLNGLGYEIIECWGDFETHLAIHK